MMALFSFSYFIEPSLLPQSCGAHPPYSSQENKGEGEMGKGDQLQRDRRQQNFW